MAHKVVPLLALVTLGLLLSGVNAGSTASEEDVDPRTELLEEEVAEVPSKGEEAKHAGTKLASSAWSALGGTHSAPPKLEKGGILKLPSRHAKASRHTGLHIRGHVAHKKMQRDSNKKPVTKAKPPVTKTAVHPSKKVNKPSKDSLIEEPVDAEDDEEPAIEQFEEDEDDADEQEAEEQFDEMDAEDPQGHISLGHPDAVEEEQIQQRREVKETSKRVKGTLAQIRKLGIHFGRVEKPKAAAPAIQESQVLASAPAKAVKKESASGLVHMSTGVDSGAKSGKKTSAFLKDRVWMIGAGESFGGLAKHKRAKKARRHQSDIIRAADTDQGNDAPHPNSIITPEFHSFAGKYRRDWSVYSAGDPNKPSKATLELDGIADINPKTGRFEAP